MEIRGSTDMKGILGIGISPHGCAQGRDFGKNGPVLARAIKRWFRSVGEKSQRQLKTYAKALVRQ